MTLLQERIVAAAGRFFQSLTLGNEPKPNDLAESSEITVQIVNRKTMRGRDFHYS